jgi:NAD(P)-dependent dehydrogenase (short-subunit alcohol dehydrogenase family)
MVLHDHQKIDILVNNAGIVKGKFFSEMTFQDFELVTRVNYLGAV